MSLKLEKKRKRKAGASVEEKETKKPTKPKPSSPAGRTTLFLPSLPPLTQCSLSQHSVKTVPVPPRRRPVMGTLKRGSIPRPQTDSGDLRLALRAQIETCMNMEYAASVTAQVEEQATMQGNVRSIMEAAQKVTEYDRHLRDKFLHFSDTYHRDNQRKNRMKLVGTLSLNSGELVPVYARMGTHDNTQLMLEPLTAALRMSGRIVKPTDQALCLFSDSGGMALPDPPTEGAAEASADSTEQGTGVPSEKHADQVSI